MLGTELPFTDIDTDAGYWINMIQPSLLCGVAFVANMIIEISVCLANNAVKSAPKVFNHASEELSTELTSNGMTLLRRDENMRARI